MPARARQCERELGAPVGDRATRAIPHDGLRCGGRRVDADDVGHAANLRLRRSLPAGGHRLLLGDRMSRALRAQLIETRRSSGALGASSPTAPVILVLSTAIAAWLAALIVTAVYAAIAGVLALTGKGK